MDSTVLIENTAQEFWALTGGAPRYPCDITTAITLTLPLEVYPISGLRVSNVHAWARRANIIQRFRGRNRRLHGCLIAYRGKGTIFFDMQDPDDEQYITLSHELAHFLLDYQAPRQRAVSVLGESILAVLDGDRPATLAERVHAVLSTVPLGVMSHLMERPDEGLPTNAVIDIEERANRLTLELLAPALPLQELMGQASAPRGFTARLAFLIQHLVAEYGLPRTVASPYAHYLLHQLGEPTFRDWLFHSTE